jgi:ASC-1-like (ASCH) protein
MATFDARLHMGAFEAMERGLKTVYTVIATDEFSVMCAGDRLEFGSFGSITIGTVRRYPDLESLVEVEGWQPLVPDAGSAEDAIEKVRSVDEWDSGQEKSLGVLALRVRETRRKT